MNKEKEPMDMEFRVILWIIGLVFAAITIPVTIIGVTEVIVGAVC